MKEYLLYGGYPKVVLSETEEEKFKNLKDIYSSYLEKDIRYLFKEDEILHLKKILYEIAKRIGSQISFADIVESV
jgi:predicted AAA+ superfamily ATPase